MIKLWNEINIFVNVLYYNITSKSQQWRQPLHTINTRFSIGFFTSLIILYFIFFSQSGANESAHEHGVGALSLAIEGNDVEIELKVPGSDAVGFEHAPSSDSERQKVNESANTLRAIENIITLSTEANCITKEVEVSSELMKNLKDDHSSSHDHNHNEKKDDHEHKGHDKSVEESHAEFIAHYHLNCEKIEKLTDAKLNFFKTFPSAHELEVKWITPNGQGAKELTGRSPVIKF